MLKMQKASLKGAFLCTPISIADFGVIDGFRFEQMKLKLVGIDNCPYDNLLLNWYIFAK